MLILDIRESHPILPARAIALQGARKKLRIVKLSCKIGAGYIPKILQNAIFGLLLFPPRICLKTRNRASYYSLLNKF